MIDLKELRNYIKNLLKSEKKKPQDDGTDDTIPGIERDHKNTPTSISVSAEDAMIDEFLKEENRLKKLGIPTVDDIDKMPTPTYDNKTVRVVELKEEER